MRLKLIGYKQELLKDKLAIIKQKIGNLDDKSALDKKF